MALTDSEIQSLRFHLCYGNQDQETPYTEDGFQAIFEQVIAPGLQTAASTTGSTTVTAGGTTTVTVASISDIVARAQLIVDVGDDAEVVYVKSVAGSTFTAKFANAHPASGYPVALMSGEARLRYLLAKADTAFERLTSAAITKTAGLKQLGKGEIEWFPGGAVLSDVRKHYHAICDQIASLVAVPRNCAEGVYELSIY
jgi:hypothetical protein